MTLVHKPRPVALGGLYEVETGPPPEPKRYGRLTVERYRAHERETGETLHVWLSGRDVTALCSEADDLEGWVLVHPLKPHSDALITAAVARGDSVTTVADLATEFPWRDTGRVGYVRITGDVTIKPGGKL